MFIPFLTAARAIESINKKAYAGVLPAIAVKIEKYCSSNSQAWPTARNNDKTVWMSSGDAKALPQTAAAPAPINAFILGITRTRRSGWVVSNS